MLSLGLLVTADEASKKVVLLDRKHREALQMIDWLNTLGPDDEAYQAMQSETDNVSGEIKRLLKAWGKKESTLMTKLSDWQDKLKT